MQQVRKVITLFVVTFMLVGQILLPVATTAQQNVSIYDIQYTTDPSGDSPYDGQIVTTSGVVSMFDGYGFIIQDRQGGPWSGVYVYDPPIPWPNLGDEVEVTGEVDEYFNFTELVEVSALTVLSSDNGIPSSEVSCTQAMTESHESVLVSVYAVTVTQPTNAYGEWEVSDASGPAGVDDRGYYYSATLGMTLTLVRGAVWYSYGAYRIEPRDALDIVEAHTFRIYDIQYPGGDSPYADQVVTVGGVVVGTYPYGYVIEDPSGGPWSGVYVDDSSNTPAEGDVLTITGEVTESNGLTQIENVSYFTVTSSGNPLPRLDGVSNGWIATGMSRAESYEGVLIGTDFVTVTNPDLGYGEWEITDESGIGARVDDIGDYTYVPALNDAWHSIRGVLWYTFGDYKIEPRYDADFVSLDAQPPSIISTDPADGTTDVNPHFSLKAVFDEEINAATIDDTTFLLEGDSGPVDGIVYYDVSRLTAVFEPDAALELGAVYTATVTGAVQDKAGNPMGVDYVWHFTTTATIAFAPYLGSLHNHTSYSDGVQDPDAAYTAARDRGLDFFAVTDHSHSVDDTEWEDTMAQAIAHTEDGAFVAIAGFEYTHSSEGHINVFNTIRRAVRTDRGYGYADYCATLEDFYAWIAQHPEGEGHFNHPAWMNFHDWQYYPDTEPMMQMLEVGNGAYSYYVWTEEEYLKALDYGWYLGPTNNGDTHNDEWGIDNPGRSGVWATELTYDGVMEAIDAMRIFTTEDSSWVLSLKGDGAWMGETIPNDGSIDFEIYTYDPDGENLVSLELVTDQGMVVTSTVPAANPYTWTFSLDISEGVHFYYVRAEQEDGDRALSTPIWTDGDVDVAPTALEIVPARLTTLTPANFTARITNRGIADAANITVTFRVDTTVVETAVVTVPVNADAFASVEWTPDVTGTVDISAEITGVPAGDNPDDNTFTVQREIVDYAVPLIVIDNGHNNNVFQSNSADDFKQDLVDYGFNWVEDTDGFAPGDLDYAVLVIISDPGEYGEDVYTEAEEQVLADYVNNGGAMLFAGDSDYHDHGNPDEINNVLEKIDGARIRMNLDGTYDDTDNGGVGPFHVLWHNFPAWQETGIAVNTDIVVGFSGCSIYGVDEFGTPMPLTTGNGITVTIYGDDDTYQNDDGGDGFYFTYTAPYTIPMAAIQLLPSGGRIAVWGDSSESFSDAFTYVQGDYYQNEIYNMETIYWLLGHPMEKMDIAEARFDAEGNDTPDHIDELVWLEGTLTAGRESFWETLYLQDDTAGIAISSVDPEYLFTDTLTMGLEVRVVGRLEIKDGETNVLIVWEPLQVWPITTGVVPDPLVFNTGDSALEDNEGWLLQTEGRVTAWFDAESFVVNDGSGASRIFLDGYNNDPGDDTFDTIQVGDWIRAIGLGSENADGQRVRVRAESDITFETAPAYQFFFPLILKNY
jgi:hypothetical protein